MAKKNIQIKGLKALQGKLDKLSKESRKEISKDIEDGLDSIRNEMIVNIQTPSAGRRYDKHVASKPGQAPNTDTGNLVNSLEAHMQGDLAGEVGSYRTKYAKYLERGTSRMEKRPFLLPAVKKIQPKIIDKIIETVNKEIKDSGLN